jgi:segregation and condensation protein A
MESLESEDELDVNLFDLLRAFQRILEELPENAVREIEREEVSTVQKMNEILDLLEGQESLAFHEVFRGVQSRTLLITTFLAMLELARMKSIAIQQAQQFGEIRIYKKQLTAGETVSEAAPETQPEEAEAKPEQD